MFYSAFTLGLLGSLHCFGMCGPLSLLLPANKESYFFGKLIYNFGRIITYMVLGLIVGFMGTQLGSLIPQKILFFVIGLFLLTYALLPQKAKNKIGVSKPVIKLNNFVKKQFNSLNGKNKVLKNLSFGLINGLLPCGLVYAALSASFLLGTPLKSTLFMGVFGLGTFPMMLSFGAIGSFLVNKVKLKPTTIYTFSFFVLGCFLLYKSYITPVQHYMGKNEMTICDGK